MTMTETERYEIAGLAEAYARASYARGVTHGAYLSGARVGADDRARKREAESEAHAALISRLCVMAGHDRGAAA